MSKRVKIERTGDWTSIDMSEVYKNMGESRKIEQEEKRIENEKKTSRINSISCPACKSMDKIHHVKRQNNGIIGSSFQSWITDEYLICKSCGIHYSDVTKLNK
jgi:C4-type Zn-finger protein